MSPLGFRAAPPAVHAFTALTCVGWVGQIPGAPSRPPSTVPLPLGLRESERVHAQAVCSGLWGAQGLDKGVKLG